MSGLPGGLLAPVLAAAITSVLLHGLRPVAIRIGLVDLPGPRKSHAGVVPLTGGVGMFCGFVFVALTLDTGLTAYRSFFAAAGVLMVVGVLDDFHELTSRTRFAAQIVAALLMAYWGGVVLHDLGELGAGGAVFALGRWEVVFTVFATVGVINALNMIDGLDGLAGGLSLVALAGLAWVAHAAGRGDDLALLVLLGAVVLAFLAF
ncbi:MAG: MraY family glycosyltransferase, partial [Gammaproteobacteria bacterium]|nr:MraY family glycosyltransferase [Gammaproteobacteria bacterium]